MTREYPASDPTRDCSRCGVSKHHFLVHFTEQEEVPKLHLPTPALLCETCIDEGVDKKPFLFNIVPATEHPFYERYPAEKGWKMRCGHYSARTPGCGARVRKELMFYANDKPRERLFTDGVSIYTDRVRTDLYCVDCVVDSLTISDEAHVCPVVTAVTERVKERLDVLYPRLDALEALIDDLRHQRDVSLRPSVTARLAEEINECVALLEEGQKNVLALEATLTKLGGAA